MIDDPIVASVRRVREELAPEFGFDVHAIFADMRNRESQFGERLVLQPVRQKSNEALPPSNGQIFDREHATPAGGRI